MGLGKPEELASLTGETGRRPEGWAGRAGPSWSPTSPTPQEISPKVHTHPWANRFVWMARGPLWVQNLPPPHPAPSAPLDPWLQLCSLSRVTLEVYARSESLLYEEQRKMARSCLWTDKKDPQEQVSTEQCAKGGRCV